MGQNYGSYDQLQSSRQQVIQETELRNRSYNQGNQKRTYGNFLEALQQQTQVQRWQEQSEYYNPFNNYQYTKQADLKDVKQVDFKQLMQLNMQSFDNTKRQQGFSQQYQYQIQSEDQQQKVLQQYPRLSPLTNLQDYIQDSQSDEALRDKQKDNQKRGQRRHREKQKVKFTNLEVQVLQLRERINSMNFKNSTLQKQRSDLQNQYHQEDDNQIQQVEKNHRQLLDQIPSSPHQNHLQKTANNFFIGPDGNKVTRHCLRNMKQLEINLMYDKWVEVLRDLMNKYNNLRTKEVVDDLQEQTKNFAHFYIYMSIDNLKAKAKLVSSNIEILEKVDRNSQDKFERAQQILVDIQVSQKQRSLINQDLKLQLSNLKQKFLILNKELDDVEEITSFIKQRVKEMGDQFFVVEDVTKCKAMIGKFQVSYSFEQVMPQYLTLFEKYVLKALQPYQIAKLIVSSYPETPDFNQIVLVIHQQSTDYEGMVEK